MFIDQYTVETENSDQSREMTKVTVVDRWPLFLDDHFLDRWSVGSIAWSLPHPVVLFRKHS